MSVIETVKKIENHHKYLDELNDLYKKYDKEIETYDFSLEDMLIRVLQESFKDKGEWISYCIYELDFLKKYKEGCVTESDEKANIDLSDWSKVYEFLLKNKEENDKEMNQK